MKATRHNTEKIVPNIKSAWEIAQEKANKLGNLSAQEREEQRQDKCRLLGEAIADKYLSQRDSRIIKNELDKHESPDKGSISGAVMRRLGQSIDLTYPGSLPDIFRGILAVSHTPSTKKTLDLIETLFQEYIEAEKKQRQEIEDACGQILHQIRVSGSAIGPVNIRAKEEWQAKLDQTASPFFERLKSLKQELLGGA